MEDLIQFGVLIFFLVVWVLGGSKKRRQSPPARPRPEMGRPPVQAEPPRAQPSAARAPSPDRPQPEGMSAILDLLRGELLPPQPQPYPLPTEPDTAEVPAEELRPLETVDAVDAGTHEAFHRRFVDAEVSEVPGARARRYILTPKTARDAIVWTVILSRPKGLE